MIARGDERLERISRLPERVAGAWILGILCPVLLVFVKPSQMSQVSQGSLVYIEILENHRKMAKLLKNITN